jgi:hypothetical protein
MLPFALMSGLVDLVRDTDKSRSLLQDPFILEQEVHKLVISI